MAIGGIAELAFGVKAEQRQLEDVAEPLTAEEEDAATTEGEGCETAKPPARRHPTRPVGRFHPGPGRFGAALRQAFDEGRAKRLPRRQVAPGGIDRQMPRRRRIPRELFETRSHAWDSLGLGEQLAPRRVSRRELGGLLVALVVLAATFVVYSERQHLAPGYGEWIRIGTVVVLVIVGTAATHWLSHLLSPHLYRRLEPATAGTTGFVIRLLVTAGVVVVALRIAGVTAGTLAVGGAFTAVLLGLAAQQALGGVFAGVVLHSVRPSGSANGCG